ncbi:MAG: type I methionyl aminopeptidase [Deltaproteobacteria bacterium]|nr:type I methionyl aminopeptidase [Deltaproteobacteria bacterium]
MDPRMLERMRDACRLAADCLLFIGEHIRPGITTDEIDRLVHDWIVKHGAYPSPLNYRPRGAPRPYPKSVCTSVNEVVCHGVPGNQVLRDGDIINVDVTVYYKGHHGDTSATFYVGTPSADAIRVVEASRQALEAGIAAVRPDARIFDIGAAIQEVAERNGCSVVRDYVGHGIGREFHMPPQIPHYRPGPGSGFRNMRLRPGMVFTIEPMINLGSHETEVLSDGWTVVTKDRKLSAQFEHTVLVTRTGCEVLTKRSGVLQNSENFPWSRCGVLSSPAVFSSTHPTPSKLELKQA